MLAVETDQQKREAEDQLSRFLNEQADRYAGSLTRSHDENDLRADTRAKIEERGYHPRAFQHAVSLARSMNKIEADHYMTSLQAIVPLLLGRQMELFPAEASRIAKREEKKAAKAGEQPRTQAELDAETDANARSDPNAGGAKPKLTVVGDGAAVVMKSNVPVDNSAAEQAEGEQVLAAMSPESQSAQAARKRKLAKVE